MLGKDSVLYAPILGIFVFTGFPLVRRRSPALRLSSLRVILQQLVSLHVVLHLTLPVLTLPGAPSQSGYLFLRCVAAANADAERMDKLDGL